MARPERMLLWGAIWLQDGPTAQVREYPDGVPVDFDELRREGFRWWAVARMGPGDRLLKKDHTNGVCGPGAACDRCRERAPAYWFKYERLSQKLRYYAGGLPHDSLDDALREAHRKGVAIVDEVDGNGNRDRWFVRRKDGTVHIVFSKAEAEKVAAADASTPGDAQPPRLKGEDVPRRPPEARGPPPEPVTADRQALDALREFLRRANNPEVDFQEACWLLNDLDAEDGALIMSYARAVTEPAEEIKAILDAARVKAGPLVDRVRRVVAASAYAEDSGSNTRRPIPPDFFSLVPLSSLPEETWKGRAVFHPHEQRGMDVFWEATPEDRQAAVEEGRPIPDGAVSYDVGIVLYWGPDKDFPEFTRVRFLLSDGSTLHYDSTNLWTPT